MDIMRGEETEAFGVISRESLCGPAILVLPGSHTKFIYLNAENQIEGCMTTMAGEMLMQLTESTILAESLHSDYACSIDREWLLKGANSAREYGLNRAAYQIRILAHFSKTTINQRANFLLGAVIQTDIQALQSGGTLRPDPVARIIVCAASLFADAMRLVLENTPGITGQVTQISRETSENLAGFGAIGLAEKAGIL